MKRACIVTFTNPHKFIRIIQTSEVLSAFFDEVDIYHLTPPTDSRGSYSDNVSFHTCKRQTGFWHRVIVNTTFTKQWNYLEEEIVKHPSASNGYSLICVVDLPMLELGTRLKKHFGAKLMYDSLEIYPEVVNQMFLDGKNPMKNLTFKGLSGFMRWYAYKEEKKLTKSVDLFITVNDSLSDFFEKTYNLHKVWTVMICPSLKNKKEVHPVDYRAMYNWTHKDVIFFNLAYLRPGVGLTLLVQALSLLPDRFKLVMIGDGILRQKLGSMVNEMELTARVKFIDRIDFEEIPSYTKGADYGVSLLEDLNLSKRYSSAMKIFDYLHAGLPFICSGMPEQLKILNRYNVGLSSGSNDIKAIAKAMSEIPEKTFDKDAYDKAAEYYSWERGKIVMEEALNSILM